MEIEERNLLVLDDGILGSMVVKFVITSALAWRNDMTVASNLWELMRLFKADKVKFFLTDNDRLVLTREYGDDILKAIKKLKGGMQHGIYADNWCQSTGFFTPGNGWAQLYTG